MLHFKVQIFLNSAHLIEAKGANQHKYKKKLICYHFGTRCTHVYLQGSYVTCVMHSAMKGSCTANWKNDGKFKAHFC